MTKIQDKDKILNAISKNQHVPYNGIPMWLTADFLAEIQRPEGSGTIYLQWW